MRLIFVEFVLLFSICSSFSQVNSSLLPAKVLDFGQLFSSYAWEPAYIAELKGKVEPALADKIISSSTESTWPSGISTLNARTDHQQQLSTYKLYYITRLSDGKAVLVAPASENSLMTQDMQLIHDIYFLVSFNAIDTNAIRSTDAGIVVPVNRFADEMNIILQDYVHDFINIAGGLIDEDEEYEYATFSSLVGLGQANDIYIEADVLSATNVFHAGFPGSIDPVFALKDYLALIQQIEGLKLPYCRLFKSEDQVDGNKHHLIFLQDPSDSQPDPAYKDLIIEVYIEQGTGYNAAGGTAVTWVPVITIHG